MKDLNKYGLLKEDEWEYLPWIDHENRPPFTFPEKVLKDIPPFILIEHHPMAVSFLLRISAGYKADIFRSCRLSGSSADWEKLSKLLISVYENENSGVGMFCFDSDEDIFCIYSEYIDSLTAFIVGYLQRVCGDDALLKEYLMKIK